eukprot:GABV01013774.1.p1 GENE.GABV01013774.1~~GABV01013774.1.p1  ORF type:complete len:137 (-),score=48.53 GABV01013774.1:11-421(-)
MRAATLEATKRFQRRDELVSDAVASLYAQILHAQLESSLKTRAAARSATIFRATHSMLRGTDIRQLLVNLALSLRGYLDADFAVFFLIDHDFGELACIARAVRDGLSSCFHIPQAYIRDEIITRDRSTVQPRSPHH